MVMIILYPNLKSLLEVVFDAVGAVEVRHGGHACSGVPEYYDVAGGGVGGAHDLDLGVARQRHGKLVLVQVQTLCEGNTFTVVLYVT